MTRLQRLDAERLSPTDASSLLGIPYELVLRYVCELERQGLLRVHRERRSSTTTLTWSNLLIVASPLLAALLRAKIPRRSLEGVGFEDRFACSAGWLDYITCQNQTRLDQLGMTGHRFRTRGELSGDMNVDRVAYRRRDDKQATILIDVRRRDTERAVRTLLSDRPLNDGRGVCFFCRKKGKTSEQNEESGST